MSILERDASCGERCGRRARRRRTEIFLEDIFMKRIRIALAATMLSLAAPMMIAPAHAETPAAEKAEHPRIAKAIHELEDAIAYMKAAPHDFGGHKAEAIKASETALQQLRLALAFRQGVDTAKGK
jgi:hypothetical protein